MGERERGGRKRERSKEREKIEDRERESEWGGGECMREGVYVF